MPLIPAVEQGEKVDEEDDDVCEEFYCEGQGFG